MLPRLKLKEVLGGTSRSIDTIMRNSGPYAPVKQRPVEHEDSYCQDRAVVSRQRSCPGNPPRCSSLLLMLFGQLPLPTLPLIDSPSRGQPTLFTPFNTRPGCRPGVW